MGERGFCASPFFLLLCSVKLCECRALICSFFHFFCTIKLFVWRVVVLVHFVVGECCGGEGMSDGTQGKASRNTHSSELRPLRQERWRIRRWGMDNGLPGPGTAVKEGRVGKRAQHPLSLCHCVPPSCIISHTPHLTKIRQHTTPDVRKPHTRCHPDMWCEVGDHGSCT